MRVGKGKAAQRYIVTVNETEAKMDRVNRQAIIDELQAQLDTRINPMKVVEFVIH
ncbi:hypothetical protein [Acidiphilium cryptum]|uniref:hypothetical protein n=1 Tax=Acidiphilium cryptum TaxID=524 RepID=UPI0002FB3A2B|nr:hypothetical protein [Acidiphilium cryptum]